MSLLPELYQELILDHNQNPRHFGKLKHVTHRAAGDNPLCGDHIDLYLHLEKDRIKDLKFESTGCAISKASASMMTDSLIGKTKKDALVLFTFFHDLVTEDHSKTTEKQVGKLFAFKTVKDYPSRVKCAILPWHALKSALEGKEETITTE